MFVLVIYYLMVILQLVTGLNWTSRKITFLRFICPLYFWFTINRPEKYEVGIDCETKGLDPTDDDERGGLFIKDKDGWVPADEFKRRSEKDIK